MARRERRVAPGQQRFIADAMLGRLARWLRLLGFDCAFEPEIEDETLVRRAVSEGRIVLTRDRALAEDWRISGIHRIEAEKLREQLAEVLRGFALAPEVRLLSRCSRCNVPLAPAAHEEVAARVPPRVLEHHDTFSACPRCGRVYWQGTHSARITRVVDDLLAQLSA
jgi:uncharacterized protein with PIN domain